MLRWDRLIVRSGGSRRRDRRGEWGGRRWWEVHCESEGVEIPKRRMFQVFISCLVRTMTTACSRRRADTRGQGVWPPIVDSIALHKGGRRFWKNTGKKAPIVETNAAKRTRLLPFDDCVADTQLPSATEEGEGLRANGGRRKARRPSLPHTTQKSTSNEDCLERRDCFVLRDASRLGRILVDAVARAVAAIFVARIVMLRPGARGGPGARRLDRELVLPPLDAEEAELAPVLSPGVPHDPVRHAVLDAPSDDGHDVVRHAQRGGVVEDAALVVHQRIRIDFRGDGAARVHLLHDVHLALDDAILRDGGVGEHVDLRAEAAVRREGVAGAAGVHRRARVVAVTAGAFSRLRGARLVLQARVIRHEARLLDEGVRANVAAAVAASRHSAAAVQNELHAQVDVDALGAACDLDAVGQRAQRAMRPARAAVLRQMLVQVLREVVHAVHVAPAEALRKLLRGHVVRGPRQRVAVRGLQPGQRTQHT
eukprot:scaffold344_cov235-Pinguiococcus_pyrenoidosus.AAC.7